MLLLNALFFIFAIALPNLMFYGWIVAFGVQAIRQWRTGHSRIKAAGLGVVALLPLMWFSADFLTAVGRVTGAVAAVRDATALPKLADPPRTLVVHGARSNWQEQLVEMGAFDEIYVTWSDRVARIANARRDVCAGAPPVRLLSNNILVARMGYLVCAKEEPAASYPRDGLHFSVGQRDSSGRARHEWLFEYELKWIEGESETRIGYFARVLQTPFLPPLLLGATFMTGGPASLDWIEPWYGEVPFLIGRLGLKPEQMRPAAQPSPEEIRAQYLRFRDSDSRAELVVAGYIAAAVGSAALSADDVAPVLASDVIDRDFARELGFQQFCNHIDRLCDFPEKLIAACHAKRAYIPESSGYRSAALRRCERIPDMCKFCRVTPRCDTYLTGQTAGCSQKEAAARDEVLRPLRESKD